MGSHLGLSDNEFELMQMFWENSGALSFPEIVSLCEKTGHQWAKTTIHTYLTRMVQKGVLQVENGRKKHVYRVSYSYDELTRAYASRFIEETFSGSLKDMIVSLVPGASLSKADIDELKQLLDQYASKEQP